LNFSQKIFENYPKIKYCENPFIRRLVVPSGLTDRHDEVNIRFSQSCERAYKCVINSSLVKMDKKNRK